MLATLVFGVVDMSNAFSRKLALEQGAQRALEKIMQTTNDDTVEGTLETEAVCQVNGMTNGGDQAVMKTYRRLKRDQTGVATIEMAFALPVLIVMIWMFVQFAQIYRALSGIQHPLGEGARYATLCLLPSSAGCATPAADDIKAKITAAVYGIGPGTFNIVEPVSGNSGTGKYFDLSVTYTQPTDLLLFPGPTINVSRSKRVWVASS